MLNPSYSKAPYETLRNLFGIATRSVSLQIERNLFEIVGVFTEEDLDAVVGYLNEKGGYGGFDGYEAVVYN